MNKTIYAVLGGDERYYILAQLLVKAGYTTFAAGFDLMEKETAGIIKTDAVTAAAMADVVVLPLPPSKDGATLNAPYSQRSIRIDNDLIEALYHSRVYTGFADRLKKQQPDFERLDIYDYSVQEAFLISNAYATAEAIIMLAIQQMPVVISDSSILVTGCGRIGKFTAMLLDKLGAHVYGASTSAANAAFMKAAGAKVIGYDALKENIAEFDLIINTADAMVITEELFSEMRKDCIIIDAASYPGGTDFKAAEIYSINAIHALGLPGKYSPVTAAKIIFETITAMEGEKHT